MLGRLSSCKGICVHNWRRASESWTASSPKNCPFAFFESGELVLRQWQSQKTTIPCHTLIGTCLIQWFHGSWRVSVPILHVSILNTSNFLKKKKICRTPSWPHNCEPSRSLNMRSGIRGGICISCARNVFSTLTWDCHPISICVASTLHHAHPRSKTTAGLCLIPLETNIDPLCDSTN